MSSLSTNRAAYKDYTREELIDALISLRLDAASATSQAPPALKEKPKQTYPETNNIRKQQPKSGIDFSQFVYRKIALKFAYLGWDYSGFSSQGNAKHTVEEYLITALKECRFVPQVTKEDYHRCGRTDKGVSALGQVVSLTVRSKIPHDHPDAILPEGYVIQPNAPTMATWKDTDEIPYDYSLNHALPKDIRILSWSPAPRDFSARFDCKGRTYKYFFPRGKLDIDKMREAAQHLLGAHDFRNFCKIDPSKGNKQTFVRGVRYISIEPWEAVKDAQDPTCIYAFTIEGSSFLFHQVRYTMSLLFLVGEGKEETDITRKLLDVEKVPEKPEYPVASPTPLVLWECKYAPGVVDFIGNEGNYRNIQNRLLEQWTEETSKATISRAVFDNLMRKDHASRVYKFNPDDDGNRVIGDWNELYDQEVVHRSHRRRATMLERRNVRVYSFAERLDKNEIRRVRAIERAEEVKRLEEAKEDTPALK